MLITHFIPKQLIIKLPNLTIFFVFIMHRPITSPYEPHNDNFLNSVIYLEFLPKLNITKITCKLMKNLLNLLGINSAMSNIESC